MKYYIYILYSSSSDRYFIGLSDDVESHVKAHNEGEDPKSAAYCPWELKASFFVSEDHRTTMKVARYMKRQKSRNFLTHVIDIHLDQAKIAELVSVPTRRD